MLLAAVYCIWLTGLSSPYVHLAITELTHSFHGKSEGDPELGPLESLTLFFLGL